MRLSRRSVLILPLAGLVGPLRLARPAGTYSPLVVDGNAEPKRVDLDIDDSTRNRRVPVAATLPPRQGAAPVVLFSHGLGGSRHNNHYLSRHWSQRGYVCLFVQHPGSDESVWKDVSARERMGAMRQAASVRNFQLRANDIPAVLDALKRWNSEPGHPLQGRMDLERTGMSGHSFGAVTTQAVSGQRFGALGAAFTDPRIRAAIAFSPSAPRRGGAQASFGSVRIPWLLMTGTKDVAVIGDADLESRLSVYPALPPGSKYELVLHNAEHSAFSDRALPGDRETRNPNHHRAILALSTAFWDAMLRNDSAARAWLDGGGPLEVLEPADRWQRK